MDSKEPAPLVGSSISTQVRAARREAVAYARASVFLEGFEGTREYVALSERFIEGALTSAQYTQASIALTAKQLASARHDAGASSDASP